MKEHELDLSSSECESIGSIDSDAGFDVEEVEDDIASECEEVEKLVLSTAIVDDIAAKINQGLTDESVAVLIATFRAVANDKCLLNDASLGRRVNDLAFTFVTQWILNCTENAKKPTQTEGWRRISFSAMGYLQDAIKQVSQGVLEDVLRLYGLEKIHELSAVVLDDALLTKRYVKMLLKLWGNADNQSIAEAAFANVLDIVRTHRQTSEMMLTASYAAYSRKCRLTNMRTIQRVLMMQEGMVRLHKLASDASYACAFSAIRVLAEHLRTAVSLKTAEAARSLYSWQYVHSLALWARVVGNSDLKYPLVQLHLGVLRHRSPSPGLHVLHLHLLNNLTLLAEHGTYIPLMPLYIALLESVVRCTRKSTLRPLDLSLCFKAPKEYHGTQVYANQVAREALNGLTRYLATLSRSAAFPELAISAVSALRRVGKTLPTVSKSISVLVASIEETAKAVAAKRAAADITPTVQDLTAFSKTLNTSPLESLWKRICVLNQQAREASEAA